MKTLNRRSAHLFVPFRNISLRRRRRPHLPDGGLPHNHHKPRLAGYELGGSE